MKPKWDLSFFTKIQLGLVAVFIIFLTIHTTLLRRELSQSKKENYGYKRFIKNHKREVITAGEASFAKIILPPKLRHIPLGEDDGVVLRTKKVNIRNVIAPYNPSIIKNGGGYLMFFRYDTQYRNAFSSYVGCVELDVNFDQTEKEFITIDTFNKHSEDPRVFQIGQKTYLTYAKSDFNKKFDFTPATINVAQIDLNNYKINFATELELNINLVEKNWSPFEYVNAKGKPEMFFQYSLNPHKILQLPNPKINHLLHPLFPKDEIFQTIAWEKAGWGTLRGGTPALKIDDKYLAFFHSSFHEKDNIFYVMGAYTFEEHPPFRVNSISRYPLVFLGMYDSVPLNSAEAHKRVIFPAGFVIDKQDDKELIHVSCGENDSGIKIITLDKEALLRHLQKI